ncbi:MAG: LOG family protein [Acidovorax sp.]|nr:MAG: LOG family protein [Acidovorax sp.]
MDANTQLNDRRLADAWAELQSHAANGNPLHADAYRLAFADPEFMFRRETRGIRFQLEMLKPDLGQIEQGIENTIVVYGSARFIAPDEADAQLLEAEASGDEGLNIALPHEQSGNRFISPTLSFKFHYFALRKMHFMMRAKALVAFPGGFGTLDELFEVLTLVQTKKAKPVPIVLFGSDYWKRLVNFEVLVEEGTISAQDLGLFHYTDDPQEAWELIKSFYQL